MAMSLLNTPKIGSVPAMGMIKSINMSNAMQGMALSRSMPDQQKHKIMTKDQMVSSMARYHGK